MPRRAVESVLSLLTAALAAWLARESEALRGLELWVAAIVAGLTILIINLRRAIGTDKASNSVLPSRPRPGPVRASATVSIVPLRGVKKVANFRNRRFQRFESGAELPEVEPPAPPGLHSNCTLPASGPAGKLGHGFVIRRLRWPPMVRVGDCRPARFATPRRTLGGRGSEPLQDAAGAGGVRHLLRGRG